MKMFVLTALLGAAALSAEARVPASAQTMPPAPGVDQSSASQGGGIRRGGLMRADANGDGIVTREEVIADADRRFAALGSDRDGELSEAERRAVRDARGRSFAPDVNDSAPPPSPTAANGPTVTSRANAPRKADARGEDGPRRAMRPQTREQARERALRMFDRADTNHDGRVDQQEIAAVRLMMRAHRAGSTDADRHDPPPSDEQR